MAEEVKATQPMDEAVKATQPMDEAVKATQPMDEAVKATQPMDEAVKAASGKTILYKITCDCYWNDVMWHKDDRVELPADLKPLEYFEKVTTK